MPVIKSRKADLKASYGIYLKVSFIITLLLLLAAFKFAPRKQVVIAEVISDDNVINIEDIINTVQKRTPPPPLKHPEPVTMPDEIPVEPEFDNNEINQNEVIAAPPLMEHRRMEPEKIPFTRWAEIMPEPIGGLNAIKEKIEYTRIGILAEIQGTVYIEAYIDENGNAVYAKILKGVGGGLDEEALNAVINTKFKPGLQGDKPVKVRMVIPVKFELR